MSERIRVCVLGACGKMGREVVRVVSEADDMELAGACDAMCVGSSLAESTGVAGLDMKVSDDFGAMLRDVRPDVVVDFAKPFCIEHATLSIESGAVPIIGTTGLTADQLTQIDRLATNAGIGAMVVPNFAIGAVLMMKFAAQAAKYMPNVEIIELHHDKKTDAPSGTSIMTAEVIEEARKEAKVEAVKPIGGDDPARGEKREGVQVHSVRLPGLVAHQEVIFGGTGQVLTIRHDSIDRTSFMPGVLLSIRKASEVKGLIYGLDKLL